MTSVKFYADKIGLYGFEISGHSSKTCDDIDGKIVCSAVSSAAYMAANTVGEIIGDRCEATVDEALMNFRVLSPSDTSRKVLEGLKLHFTELSKQYSSRIVIMEV